MAEIGEHLYYRYYRPAQINCTRRRHVVLLPWYFELSQALPAPILAFNGPGYGAMEEAAVELARG